MGAKWTCIPTRANPWKTQLFIAIFNVKLFLVKFCDILIVDDILHWVCVARVS